MKKGETQAAGGPHNTGGPRDIGEPHNTELLRLAVKAALEAGAEILEVYKSGNFDVRHKADDSPLTLADRRAHETIKKVLQETGIPLLSEEGADIPHSERKNWNSYWLVDPLDGTKEFIKRNGEFTVNIALMTADLAPDESPAGRYMPSAGVVYVPVKDTAYIGMRGKETWKGAWRVERASKLLNTLGSLGSPSALGSPNSQQRDIFSLLESAGIRLPAVDPDSRPFTAVVSRSHNSPETEKLMDKLEAEYGRAERVSSGSSIKLCLVAEGTADLYPRFAPTMEWDTAAGDAVCRAAGCMVTGRDRKTPLIYNKEDLHNPWFVVLGPRMV